MYTLVFILLFNHLLLFIVLYTSAILAVNFYLLHFAKTNAVIKFHFCFIRTKDRKDIYRIIHLYYHDISEKVYTEVPYPAY